MNAKPVSAYLFATAAQWNACLLAGSSREEIAKRHRFVPEPPYAREALRIDSPGATAPAFTQAGSLLWRNGEGQLLRAAQPDAQAQRATAPWAIAHAARLISTSDILWSIGVAANTLEAFELDTLTRRRVVTIPDGTIVDAAADGQRELLLLIRRGAACEVAALDGGDELNVVACLPAELAPTRIAYLAAQQRILLLADGGTRLIALARPPADARPATAAATPLWTRQLSAFRPCFAASRLASDGRGRIFLAGADGERFGGKSVALVLDADATLVDAIELTRQANGIAGGRGRLAISDDEGLSIFGTATAAGSAAALECELVTPLLAAPDTGAELTWQRAELWATLPPGTTLDVRYGWSDDAGVTARALELSADTRISSAERLACLVGLLPHWSPAVSFAGSVARSRADELAPPLAFPLLDARSLRLWLHVRLRATPGSALPAVSRMVVSYASSAMLQQLPAVFRRTATQAGDFLGALVGTLEASSQDLDRRIAALGSLVHPDTAPAAWLDEVADWLGLPWDDALSLTQKRAIVSHAGELSAGHGTRAGLETLLSSLFPPPACFLLRDVDVDFGFVRLGGCALPAVLAGLPRSASVLSRKAVLGRARLPCRDAVPSATRHLAGQLRVEVMVDSVTQRASKPWLSRLLDAMVPAHLRIDLRWRPPATGNEPGEVEFADPPPPQLGRGAITGSARLPHGRVPTLWP